MIPRNCLGKKGGGSIIVGSRRGEIPGKRGGNQATNSRGRPAPKIGEGDFVVFGGGEVEPAAGISQSGRRVKEMRECP